MMITSKKKNYRRAGIAAVLAVGALVAAAGLWLPGLPFSSADTATDSADHYFQKLGIIRLNRIPPPVDFVLADLKGRTVRLSDFTGKVVFLNFWTTWCPECRVEIPALEKLYQHFKDRDFTMLAVTLRESETTVRQYVHQEKLNFKALLDSDGRVGRRFGIRSIPTTIIIDQDGAMIGKGIGSREWDSPAAKALFDYLINHPPGRRVYRPK